MISDRGHNNPPSQIEFSEETTRALAGWMVDHPVISTEDEAREAKVYVDRASLCLKDLEDERDGKVRPLNEQVKEINATYKAPRGRLEGALSGLRQRVSTFLKSEEERKAKIAEEARKAAEEAEQRAREAEERERQLKEEAASGACVDVVSATESADAVFDDYKLAERARRLAERDADRVRVGGGFARALTLKNKEYLSIVDYGQAISEMGLSERVSEAILSDARAYRKATGELPNGVTATYEREI